MIIEILVGAASGGVTGFFTGRLRPRLPSAHQHAWSMWEDCQLRDGGREGLVPGQKRDCFGCGEREVRNIIAQHKT